MLQQQQQQRQMGMARSSGETCFIKGQDSIRNRFMKKKKKDSPHSRSLAVHFRHDSFILLLELPAPLASFALP